MKKLLLTLIIFLFCFSPVYAVETTMNRSSDNLKQEEIDSIIQKTGDTVVEQQQGTLQTNIDKTPQVFTLYGWYSPEDNSYKTSSNAIITGGETRATLGSPNSNEGLETLKIYSKSTDLAFNYSVKLEGEDWQEEKTGTYDLSQSAGNTSENSKKIVNLKINLNGPSSVFYDIFYRANLNGSGWSDWATGGNPVVAEENVSHISSLDLRILPKGSPAPPTVVETQNIPLILASANISNLGQTKTIVGKNIELGQENSGQAIEGIELKTSNKNVTLSCQSYVSGQGWQDIKNGEFSGTKDQGLPLEAVKIKLEGDQAGDYDVYYRSYVEGYGWLDWANNDQISGTLNQGLKVEAIHLRILPKGSLLPGSTDLPSVIAYNPKEGEFLKALNLKRHEKGLLPVTSNRELNQATEARLNELKAKYSHLRPNEQGFETILTDLNYRTDSIKLALGECFTKSADINKVIENFENTEICQSQLFTDYYRYCSLASSDDPISTILLTNEASNYVYLY